ncbi:hypothetical protein [Vibrio navarrensis]|uniref:phage tail tip protein J-related protein n=1 Tax=Vibrio navarrensis TaxID=29495 RepID=UPI0018664776|nr:hypothetical protein [Vibrio navarrensis]MBE3653504.1 hypothetical protein [Vibrio navarrensis]
MPVAVVAIAALAVAAYVAVETRKQQKKMKDQLRKSRDTEPSKYMFKNSAPPKQIILGHVVTSGPEIYAEEFGQPNKDGVGEAIHYVVHLAGHPCEAVTNVWFDEQELTRRDDLSTPDQIVFEHPSSRGWAFVYLGTHTEAPDTLYESIHGWSSDMIGKDQCFIHVRLRSDPAVWTNGIPNVKAAIKGMKLFDPRTGKTEWSDNPALMMRWYRTALKRGVPIDESYISSANICDELVAVPGGHEKRYRCNYVFFADTNPRTVLSKIRAACGGDSLRVAGRHAMQVGAYYGPATITLNENDIIGDIKTTADLRRRDLINSVSATYVDPEDNWNESDMPRVKHAGYIEHDGYEIVDDLSLTTVPSPYQAQRLAMQHLLTSRDAMTIELTVTQKAIRLLPGSLFRLDLTENAWQGVEFKVTKWISSVDGQVTLEAQQTKLSHYEFDGVAAQVPSRPGLPNLLNRDTQAVTNLSYTTLYDSNTLQAIISWEHLSYGGTSFELSFYKDGEFLRKETTVDKQYRLLDGFEVGQYEVQVVAISYERRSPIASLVFNAAAPQTPIGIDVKAENWALGLTPVSAGVVNFDTMYDFALGFEQGVTDAEIEQSIIGRAKVITVSNLKANTTYQIAVREVSRWGKSGWYRSSAQTTFNSDDVLELIDGKVTQTMLDNNLNDFLTQVDERSKESQQDIVGINTDIDQINTNIQSIDTELALVSESIELELAQINSSLSTSQELQSQLSSSVLGVTSSVAAMANEYQRRFLNGEAMIGAVVQVDPETGQIINLAFNYADQKFTQAGLLIDGVKASVTIQSQEIKRVELETGDRLTEAEAQIVVQAGLISQKASYSEVNEIVAGAIDAITPARSWQFNTTNEGWTGATWVAGGHVTGTAFSIAGLDIDADENTTVRLRVKSSSAGALSWNGGSQNVSLKQPADSNQFEVIILTLTAADGWTGTIQSLEINFDATIDFIEVGKPSAAEQALEDLTARTTHIEQELDPANARWGIYVTQEYWDGNALTLTDVQQKIDAYDAEWSISATFQELSANDTIAKANSAESWVNAANANITDVVTSYVSQPGGINDQLEDAGSRLNSAQQEIDALEGTITQTITSLSDVQGALGVDAEAGLADILGAYKDFLAQQKFEEQKISFAYAEQKISAISTQIEAQASSILQLGVQQGSQKATLTQVQKAIADQDSALSQTELELKAQIESGDSTTLAAANQTTSQAFANAQEALSQTESQLQAQIESGDSTTLAAANQTTSQAFANAQEALAQTEAQLQAQIESGDSTTLAAANQTTSQAFANAQEALSQTETQLQAQIESGDSTTLAAANQTTSQAFANAQEALSQTETQLQAQIESGDSTTLAAANQTTSQAFANAQEALSQTEAQLQAQIESGDSTTLAAANQTSSQAFANAQEALSQTETQLQAQIESGDSTTLAAANQTTSQAFANAQEALSQTEAQLQAQIESGDSTTLAAANAYTRAAVGYCVDEQGNITSETDAVLCVQAGHNWIQGPLAEYIRNLSIQNAAGETATISDMMQAFESDDGNLIVRGGLTINNQGKISGFVNTNDGTLSQTDFVADFFRIGTMNGTSFNPSFYLDSVSKKLVLKGRLVLDDGELITNKEQLQGQDGKPGTIWGTLKLRAGIFPSDALATSDFTARYGRAPMLDDMLTYVSNDGAVSSVKSFSGTSWAAPALRLSGDLITPGSVYGDRFVAGTTISAPHIEGGTGNFLGKVQAGEIVGVQSASVIDVVINEYLNPPYITIPERQGYIPGQSDLFFKKIGTVTVPQEDFDRVLMVEVDVSEMVDLFGVTEGSFDEKVLDSNLDTWPFQTALIARLFKVESPNSPSNYPEQSDKHGVTTLSLSLQYFSQSIYRATKPAYTYLSLPASIVDSGNVTYEVQLAIRPRRYQSVPYARLDFSGITIKASVNKSSGYDFSANIQN